MKYAAFFRGINVGGKNLVKMADLKRLFETLGFQDVRTYIQSGNVIFATDKSKDAAVTEIKIAFLNAFGFESAVILRSADEMSEIIHCLPFTDDELKAVQTANPAVEHLYVFMLEQAPPEAELSKIYDAYAGNDKLHMGKRDLYLLCCESIRDSKLAVSLGKLPVAFTSRNWKTTTKMYGLMGND
jgi:uncharacterized protein (DUF1697 family)